MNIAVILEYFEYFTHFPRASAEHRYSFCTVHKKHVGSGIDNITYCDWTQYPAFTGDEPLPAWREYFKAAVRLNMLSHHVDYQAVARLYEAFFTAYFEKNHIQILVCGGTTGFERCGIAVAKKMGIATLCVWEGLFRPDTISYDPDGMNAESAFYRTPYFRIMAERPSADAMAFIRKYADSLKPSARSETTLSRIQRGKFDILRQAKNRWTDRNDLERIRLPFRQHVYARLSYWNAKRSYTRLSDVKGKYIFFPLQTHTDSSIAINSSAVPFNRFVDGVISAFRHAYAGTTTKLLIKEHPFDVFRIAYARDSGEDVLWCAPETNMAEIFANEKCLGVVVVNSTAGFEGLLTGKLVVVLGRSLYSHRELVRMPESTDVNGISSELARLAEGIVDKEAVEAYAARLFEQTQFKGNLDRIPDEAEIIHFERLLEATVHGGGWSNLSERSQDSGIRG